MNQKPGRGDNGKEILRDANTYSNKTSMSNI